MKNRSRFILAVAPVHHTENKMAFDRGLAGHAFRPLSNPHPKKTNAIEDRKIFAFWTGPNKMGAQRYSCLQTMMQYFPRGVVLVTSTNVGDFILEEHPLHHAYRFLSETHKADYLRTYFMHFYGGGYSDIKKYNSGDSWEAGFRSIETNATLLAVGYPEIGRDGVASAANETVKDSWRRLLGNVAYIFREKSIFTARWLEETENRLDRLSGDLEIHPAQSPQDVPGLMLPSGQVSNYPVPWTYLLGDVFHPLCFEFADYLKQSLVPPAFSDYRD